MSIDKAKLEEMRDILLVSRASGTRLVQFGDNHRVEYKTDAEMAAALADLDRRISLISRPKAKAIRFGTSKGL